MLKLWTLFYFIIVVVSQTCNPLYRKDCGYNNQNTCEQNGCCWDPIQEGDKLGKGIAWCFSKWEQTTYQMQNLQSTSYGYEADLILANGYNSYGQDITPLHLSVFFDNNERLHVKIFDPTNTRWEVPFVINDTEVQGKTGVEHYNITFTENTFGFSVIRKSNGDVIFDTSVTPSTPANGLVFEDQYLEISTALTSESNIYGLGERIRPLRLDTGIYTFWNIDEGAVEQKNIYGHHPFYMDVRNGLTHGVFFIK